MARYDTEEKRKRHRESQLRYKMKNVKAFLEHRRLRQREKEPEEGRRYRETQKIKYTARKYVRQAVTYGKIVRPDHCSRCGVVCKPDAHHKDYSKIYEVEWLCRKCHLAEHGKQLRASR